MEEDFGVRLMPLGDGGGSSSGTGAPIGGPSGSTPVVSSQKLPNAMAATPAAETKPKIQAFSQGLGAKRHTEDWKRKTNVNGTGATHVKTFHCKLSSESVEYMDQQINQWLDDHPDYEVKFVTSTVGEWTGKIKEPALIVNVWV
ncbi:MAG: hypothetical protein ACK4WH_11645 [Phycisphaerales bacterium]